VSEAALTGESLPVAKSAQAIAAHSVPLGDRVNMVYRGTIVTGGSGRAVVVATGARTEVGRIQRIEGRCHLRECYLWTNARLRPFYAAKHSRRAETFSWHSAAPVGHQ
jgi:E1-E2 ATPase